MEPFEPFEDFPRVGMGLGSDLVFLGSLNDPPGVPPELLGRPNPVLPLDPLGGPKLPGPTGRCGKSVRGLFVDVVLTKSILSV